MKLEIELFNKVIANKDYSENSKKIIKKSVKWMYKNIIKKEQEHFKILDFTENPDMIIEELKRYPNIHTVKTYLRYFIRILKQFPEADDCIKEYQNYCKEQWHGCLCQLGGDRLLSEDHMAGCNSGGHIIKRHGDAADGGSPSSRDGGDSGTARSFAWIWPGWARPHVSTS